MRMMRINNKLTLAASLTAVMVGLAGGIALAQGSDTDDNISPSNTSFTETQSGSIVFQLVINGLPIKITCKNASISGTTPATGSGLGPFNISNPNFSNCTDQNGLPVTIMTNSTNGPWQLTYIDALNDQNQTEPNTGDRQQTTIPKAGMTFTFSFIPGCKITAAPNGPANMTGTYNDATGTLTFTNASFPATAAGCTLGPGSASDSSRYQSTPVLHDSS